MGGKIFCLPTTRMVVDEEHLDLDLVEKWYNTYDIMCIVHGYNQEYIIKEEREY